ncbi:MAG: IS630 family transposase [Moorea sp. SIO3E2]|nr:IS630 family transposase [Moorena sp. SIO3E2]
MPKRLTISPHLTIDELEQGYRQAKTVTERSHYQILWLLAKGNKSEEVAAVTGYSRSWIYELVRSYNHLGNEALGDLRRHNRGALPKLDDVQQANLLQAIRGVAPDGGLWNGRKVADYLSQLLGKPVSRQQGWKYLKQMEFRLRVPRPQHQHSDEHEQEVWKKKLRDEVNRVQMQYHDADVEIWCQDEHRIGLQPVMRRVWVELGETAIARVNWKREWLWLYAFVQPHSGETYWWLLPYVNTELFNRVLKDFAEHFKLGKDKRVILPLDQAGWHTTDKLMVPEGIHLLHLPPYSPELQPAERLWPLVNEPLVNQAFDSMAEVEELVYQRCQRLLQQQELIRGLTFYDWLLTDEVA